VRVALHLRDVLKAGLSPGAAAALAKLETWHKAGCRMDRAIAGTETAEGVSTFFRLMATPLAGKYGGGESGLCRFLRDAQARIEKDPRAAFSAEEVAFIDQSLASAGGAVPPGRDGNPASRPERPQPARPQPAPRGPQQRMGYFDSLDGLGTLDAQGDLRPPDLSCVDGATIRSQAGQSYTQYVPLHDVDSAMSLLPPGHGERTDDPYRTSTVKLWEKGQLHPAPLSREAVEKIAAERVTLSR